eukprot:s1472_g2.t1
MDTELEKQADLLSQHMAGEATNDEDLLKAIHFSFEAVLLAQIKSHNLSNFQGLIFFDSIQVTVNCFPAQAQRLARRSIKITLAEKVDKKNKGEYDEDPDREHRDDQSDEDKRANNVPKGPGSRGRGKGRGRGRGRPTGSKQKACEVDEKDEKGNKADEATEPKENQTTPEHEETTKPKETPAHSKRKNERSDGQTAKTKRSRTASKEQDASAASASKAEKPNSAERKEKRSRKAEKTPEDTGKDKDGKNKLSDQEAFWGRALGDLNQAQYEMLNNPDDNLLTTCGFIRALTLALRVNSTMGSDTPSGSREVVGTQLEEEDFKGQERQAAQIWSKSSAGLASEPGLRDLTMEGAPKATARSKTARTARGDKPDQPKRLKHLGAGESKETHLDDDDDAQQDQQNDAQEDDKHDDEQEDQQDDDEQEDQQDDDEQEDQPDDEEDQQDDEQNNPGEDEEESQKDGDDGDGQNEQHGGQTTAGDPPKSSQPKPRRHTAVKASAKKPSKKPCTRSSAPKPSGASPALVMKKPAAKGKGQTGTTKGKQDKDELDKLALKKAEAAAKAKAKQKAAENTENKQDQEERDEEEVEETARAQALKRADTQEIQNKERIRKAYKARKERFYRSPETMAILWEEWLGSSEDWRKSQYAIRNLILSRLTSASGCQEEATVNKLAEKGNLALERYKGFLEKMKLDILYADLAGSEIPFTVSNEDDFGEASQAICGKLFLELWSADMERGFPMPKGCYYKGYPTGNRREVFVVFEGKNGLRKDTTYQMVFNGIVREDNEPPIPNVVVANAQLLEIFPMDDVTSRPYEAIERGTVSLTTEPKSPTRTIAGAEDPQFAPGGFKILGGYQDLLEIKAGDSLNVELLGFPTTAGRIRGSDIIRIFLWPLTQWQTTSSCTAECIESGEISFLCGQITSCLGLPTVPGMALNILKITLPACDTAATCQFDDLYGNRKVRIRIGGITIPSGGFFAQRLAAQVSDFGDSRPNYVLSAGSYIYKEPNAGITSAKVVSQLGGGNAKPFRGDTMNVLYARLTLSSTIKARDNTYNDASFTITLPEGYTCRDMSATAEPPGINTWMAEMDLPAFGSQVPQGRGTPTDGSATHGWTAVGNQCIYTPQHPDGIVFAGSSLVVKITVDNPTFALQRADDKNVWTVHYANIGLHQFGNLRIRRETQKYRFSSAADLMYQSNNAVLGIISDVSCQPQVLSASTAKSVYQDLHFFFRTEQEAPSRMRQNQLPPVPPVLDLETFGGAMGIERAFKAKTPAAAATATAMLKVTVVSLTGETLLEEEMTDVNSKDVMSKLSGTTCFDKLLMDGNTVSGNIEVPEGAKAVTLTLVRVDMGLLSGISEDMMQVLADFGAIQEAPAALSDAKMGQCLSVAKRDGEHCSGGGFGDTERMHHLILLPEGRILAKYHYCSDYMEHSGDYSCCCTWEIAEGHFTPCDEPGVLEVEWSAWSELVHRTTEPFGPGEITGTWEAKVIDPAMKRGPSILVPTDHGKLSVPKLCEKWAKEGEGGIPSGRTRSARAVKSEKMPKLSEEILKTLGMEPRHLAFWELVGPGGLVRLVAPTGFNFGQPCNATDLPAPYYATQANPVDATLRLPGILSCISRGSELRTAEMRLERILHGGRVLYL